MSLYVGRLPSPLTPDCLCGTQRHAHIEQGNVSPRTRNKSPSVPEFDQG